MAKHEGGIFGLQAKIYSFFAKRSGVMQRIYKKVSDDLLEEIEKIKTGNSKIKLLDIGIGPGLALKKFESMCEIYGIDVSEDMIREAKRNLPYAHLKVASVEEIPFPDDYFDLVVSILSAHHWQEPAKAIREIKRVLKKGGKAILWDIHPNPPLLKLLRISPNPLTVFQSLFQIAMIKSGHFKKVNEFFDKVDELKEERPFIKMFIFKG